MKNILLLGAGLVAGPTVRYLMAQPYINIQVADQVLEKAQALVGDNPRGTALEVDVNDRHRLTSAIAETDIVISLLPWTLHLHIAHICLELKKHLITASYVKEEMQALDQAVQESGLLFLNEVGVDPGLDHMSAMKVIDRVKKEGGHIDSFFSYCGGLPALESNNNPLGYKFSWSPEGAMLATTNNGQYMEKGKVIEVPGNRLFEHYWLKSIPGAGVFEAYVNRNALPYMKIYGIEDTREMYRGTLRNIGYCETWDFLNKLGLLNQKMKFDLDEVSPREVLANIVNCRDDQVKTAIADHLNIPVYSLTLKKLEWLGLFSNQKLNLGTVSVFEMFAHTLKDHLSYDKGEMDLLIMHHEFEAIYPDLPKQRIQSTLIDTGIPGGDSSMARTVGYPVGIAAALMASEKIDMKGVGIPVAPQIYEPILTECEKKNIRFIERRSDLDTGERSYWGD